MDPVVYMTYFLEYQRRHYRGDANCIRHYLFPSGGDYRFIGWQACAHRVGGDGMLQVRVVRFIQKYWFFREAE